MSKKDTVEKYDKNTIFCSFCGKDEHEVAKLVAGPTVFICDECISLCVGIMQAADGTYLNKIIHETRKDKSMKKIIRTIDDAPDEFWSLLNRWSIYHALASSILETDKDMTAAMSDRAYNFMETGKIAEREAWLLIRKTYPDMDTATMSASQVNRKINILG